MDCPQELETSCRLEASFTFWKVHGRKPSTYAPKPPKLGALREVARDNIYYMVGGLPPKVNSIITTDVLVLSNKEPRNYGGRLPFLLKNVVCVIWQSAHQTWVRSLLLRSRSEAEALTRSRS